MPQKRYKWLPPYNAIFILSVMAGLLVTFAFLYFSFYFFQTEKMISRRAYLPHLKRNALRAVVASGLGEKDKSPIEAELLSYLSRKLGKEVVPVQRETSYEAEKVMVRKGFDIAFTSEKAYLIAEKNNYVEALVIPVLKNKPMPQTPISVRKDMDAKAKQTIRKIFLNMNSDGVGSQILSDLGIGSFVEPAK